jgi:hypothetical protein
LPPAIWPCVLASCFGCTLIAFSKSPYSPSLGRSVGNNGSNDDAANAAEAAAAVPPSFTADDAVGCALQFASMCFSAGARLLMKATEDVLTRNEAVQTNNACNFVFPLLYTLVANPAGWVAFLRMTPTSFAAWVVIAVLVYTFGSAWQMSLVRSMGPGAYSSLGGVRVLASAALSAACLAEPVDGGPLEWAGLLVVVVTVTAYTLASVGAATATAAACCGSSSSSCGRRRPNDAGSLASSSSSFDEEDGDIDMKALIRRESDEPEPTESRAPIQG